MPLYRSFNEFEKKIMNHKCGPVKVLGPSPKVDLEFRTIPDSVQALPRVE